MLPTRRLSTHNFVPPVNDSEPRDKESEDEKGSSSDDIKFENPQNGYQSFQSAPTPDFTHTESQVDHDTESDTQHAPGMAEITIQSPQIEQDSHLTENSSDPVESERMIIENLQVDPTLLSPLPPSPFLRGHLDSDSSVPPARRRHRRARGMSSTSGYSTISQSATSSPGSKFGECSLNFAFTLSDSDYATDHKPSVRENIEPTSFDTVPETKVVIAISDSIFYLITLTSTAVIFAELQCPISTIQFPVDMNSNIPISPSFTVQLDGIVLL